MDALGDHHESVFRVGMSLPAQCRAGPGRTFPVSVIRATAHWQHFPNNASAVAGEVFTMIMHVLNSSVPEVTKDVVLLLSSILLDQHCSHHQILYTPSKSL
jgi:hypothetical protein